MHAIISIFLFTNEICRVNMISQICWKYVWIQSKKKKKRREKLTKHSLLVWRCINFHCLRKTRFPLRCHPLLWPNISYGNVHIFINIWKPVINFWYTLSHYTCTMRQMELRRDTHSNVKTPVTWANETKSSKRGVIIHPPLAFSSLKMPKTVCLSKASNATKETHWDRVKSKATTRPTHN